jgi:hypothetical protein
MFMFRSAPLSEQHEACACVIVEARWPKTQRWNARAHHKYARTHSYRETHTHTHARTHTADTHTHTTYLRAVAKLQSLEILAARDNDLNTRVCDVGTPRCIQSVELRARRHNDP